MTHSVPTRRSSDLGDSRGGVVEVLAYGVPPGIGSHVHWDRRLDTLVAAALMSIQAVKAVEIGEGFEVAGLRGSAGHKSEEHTSELQSLMRISYAVFCLKKKNTTTQQH